MYTTASITWHTNPRRVLRKRPRQQDHMQASRSRNLLSTAMQHGAHTVRRAQRRRSRGYPRLTRRRTNKRTVPSRRCSQTVQKCAPNEAPSGAADMRRWRHFGRLIPLRPRCPWASAGSPRSHRLRARERRGQQPWQPARSARKEGWAGLQGSGRTLTLVREGGWHQNHTP